MRAEDRGRVLMIVTMMALGTGAWRCAPEKESAPEVSAPPGRAAVTTAALDTARIAALTGAQGAYTPEADVYKVSVPRTDLDLTIRGVEMTPGMGLTSWAAFKPAGSGTVLTGDLVLLESEVNPVMTAVLESNLEVTALHNHFFWDDPKIMFMHIGGHGPTDSLAAAVGSVFERMRIATAEDGVPPGTAIRPAGTTLDPAAVASILGIEGTLQDGVYKVTISKTTEMAGADLGAAMGVNTWAAFAGSAEAGVVDGDFAVYGNELQGVLRALRASGIDVVAIHNHMIGESPNVVFLHYWGMGPVDRLARGIRAALDSQEAIGEDEERGDGGA